MFVHVCRVTCSAACAARGRCRHFPFIAKALTIFHARLQNDDGAACTHSFHSANLWNAPNTPPARKVTRLSRAARHVHTGSMYERAYVLLVRARKKSLVQSRPHVVLVGLRQHNLHLRESSCEASLVQGAASQVGRVHQHSAQTLW